MTLREKLDNKVKKAEVERFFKEIEEIFLKFDVEELSRGVTIKIFSDDSKDIFYQKNSSEEENITRIFCEKYKIETFEKMIPLLVKNGLEVEYYKINGIINAEIKYKP